MISEKKSIQTKVLHLVGIFMAAIICVLYSSEYLHNTETQLHKQHINQNAREALGNIIQRKILIIEVLFLKLIAVNDPRDIPSLHKQIVHECSAIDKVLVTLREGGTYKDTVPVNFLNINEITENISFQPQTKGQYIVEILDLTPKIQDIKKTTEQLIEDLYSNFNTVNQIGGAHQINIKTSPLIIHVKTLIQRAEENTNLIFYKTHQKNQDLQEKSIQTLQVSRSIRYVVSLITAILGIVALIISRQIKKIQDDRDQLLKEAEETKNYVNAIHDSVPAGIMVIDSDKHQIIDINKAALELIGTTKENVVGKICHDYMCPAQVGLCPITDLKNDVFNNEVSLITAAGNTIDILKSVVRVHIGDRDLLLEILVDIRERKKAEEKLKNAHEELRLMNENLETRVKERTRDLDEAHSQLAMQEKMASIGQLAAGISHELNNPINFIRTNFATLTDNFSDLESILRNYKSLQEKAKIENLLQSETELISEQEKELSVPFILEDIPVLFKESKHGFERIDAIIQSMRNFSRMDKKGKLNHVDINKGIKDTLIIARNEYKYHAEIKTNFGDIEECLGSPGQLNQVFLNLIVNSAHAIESMNQKEKGLITITTLQQDNYIVCTIGDNGPGIPVERRSQIFDPFFTTKDPGKGTGLGLSISYDIIVKNHHGKLDVHCPAEGGTVFTISLPVAKD